MARDKKNDPSSRKGAKPPKRDELPPEDKQPEEPPKVGGFVGGFGQFAKFVNDSVYSAANLAVNPATPLEWVDNKIPLPFIGADDGVKTAGDLFFKATETAFTKAADFVGNHGKKNPNPTQVASADNSLGGNGKLPKMKNGKGNEPAVS